MMIISGLLITGGDGSDGDSLSSTELWSPGLTSSPVSCTLPPMKRSRSGHTLSGGLACGGWGADDTWLTCEVLTGAGWELLDSRLSEGRRYHSAWLQPTTNTTFLLGGGDKSSRRISETVTIAGEVAKAALTLKHDVK